MFRIEGRAIDDAELRLMDVNGMRIGGEIADLPELRADAWILGERIHPRQRVPGSIRVDSAEQADARAERHGIRIAARRLPDWDCKRAVGVGDDVDAARV